MSELFFKIGAIPHTPFGIGLVTELNKLLVRLQQLAPSHYAYADSPLDEEGLQWLSLLFLRRTQRLCGQLEFLSLGKQLLDANSKYRQLLHDHPGNVAPI